MTIKSRLAALAFGLTAFPGCPDQAKPTPRPQVGPKPLAQKPSLDEQDPKTERLTFIALEKQRQARARLAGMHLKTQRILAEVEAKDLASLQKDSLLLEEMNKIAGELGVEPFMLGVVTWHFDGKSNQKIFVSQDGRIFREDKGEFVEEGQTVDISAGVCGPELNWHLSSPMIRAARLGGRPVGEGLPFLELIFKRGQVAVAK